MTDITHRTGTTVAASPQSGPSAAERRLKRRYAKNWRFQAYGISAIAIALLILGTLIGSMIATGYHALTQTHLDLTVEIPADAVDPASPGDGDYRQMARTALLEQFPTVAAEDERALTDMLSAGAPLALRDRIVGDPSLIGSTIAIMVPVSDPFDQLAKGLVQRDTPEDRRRVTDQQIVWFDQLADDGAISRPLNWALLTSADSRHPELAGLKGALIGSFYALLVCFLISFPVGVSAAIYLEEFAPKNRWTDLIEVNINNLAAVPSIVFGLLGLAVFLNFFGLPRSAPLVGGMVLSLMTLPTIIIATRNALKAVPPSIREAALAVGASRLQTVLHHVLPLAMPGILTGTIIGLAQALGETAPLLLIGMNAFITSAPDSMFSPSTALPTQIYIWADSPERGFTSRTSAAILVVLCFMICMNAIAIFMRRKFENRW
ncbi:phosphate ABC transporter permease PstA [Fodinicurvata sp. EGI_FJ10296]|uniref:phosphate ABC transporter permease PstA n=1 Tax=Fodinicurvata sp. EGI_FJ10296 TaxID=3231908 RepID=UPI0034518AE4